MRFPLAAIAVAVLAGLLAACVSTGSEKPELAQVATAGRIYPVEHGFEESGDGREVHFAEVGEKRARAVVFVHGTPGSWRAFEGYLAQPALAERARLVAVDRLGFGRSEPGRAETSLERQAASLAPLLRRLMAEAPAAGRPILVGHSYGGPVIARFAMDYPGLAGGLVMVAPSIDPGLERLRWYNHVASWRLFNWSLPAEWLTSNREILPLKKELEAMLGGWDKIAAPAIVIQGDADKLVPAGNADFAARKLPAERLKIERVPGAGHFVLWQQPQLVVKAILELLAS